MPLAACTGFLYRSYKLRAEGAGIVRTFHHAQLPVSGPQAGPLDFIQEKMHGALDIPALFHYNTQADGVWRSLVSRLVRDQEASGSNPDTPTIKGL